MTTILFDLVVLVALLALMDKVGAEWNDAASALLGVYAKAEKGTAHEAKEANKAARDEKAIAQPIQKKGPENRTQKSSSAKSDSANNLQGRSAYGGSRGGFAELAFGDRPTDFGFGHNSGAAIEG